ncbi:MAG: GHKL domain-containing protein [Lachnospiraceae bacterium]|nr:GHKL domain-containing protein [Lachnospiraceae bacterium]
MYIYYYVIAVLKHAFGYEVFFRKSLDHRSRFVVMGILYGIAVFFCPEKYLEAVSMLAYGMAYAAILFCMSGDWKQRMFHFMYLIFMVACLDRVISIIFCTIDLWMGLEEQQGFLGHVIDGCKEVLSLVFFLTVYCCKRKLDKQKREKLVNWCKKVLPFFILFLAIGMLMTISALNLTSSDKPRGFQILATVVCSMSLIGIMVLVVFSLYVKEVNDKMAEVMQKEALLIEMQREYYEKLLQKENATRNYRHDMENHFTYLNYLAEREDMSTIKSYLKKMTIEMDAIKTINFQTGNKMIDVITTYYLAEIKGVDVSVKGNVPSCFSEENLQLCSIYGNLVKNAVEEMERGKEEDRQWIRIEFVTGRENFRIVIENTLSEKSRRKRGFATEKEDGKNHGIGLKNVKRAVEELGGRLELERKNDIFLAKVTFKMTV